MIERIAVFAMCLGPVLIFALCVAWYLIRTAKMPDAIDYDPYETPVKDLPDSEKMSIKDLHERHKHYKGKS